MSFPVLTDIAAQAAAITAVTGKKELVCSGYVGYLPVPEVCGGAVCNCRLNKAIKIMNRIYVTDFPRMVACMETLTALAGVAAIGPLLPPVDNSLEERITALNTWMGQYDAGIAALAGKLDDADEYTMNVLEALAGKIQAIQSEVQDNFDRVQKIGVVLVDAVS